MLRLIMDISVDLTRAIVMWCVHVVEEALI